MRECVQITVVVHNTMSDKVNELIDYLDQWSKDNKNAGTEITRSSTSIRICPDLREHKTVG